MFEDEVENEKFKNEIVKNKTIERRSIKMNLKSEFEDQPSGENVANEK